MRLKKGIRLDIVESSMYEIYKIRYKSVQMLFIQTWMNNCLLEEIANSTFSIHRSLSRIWLTNCSVIYDIVQVFPHVLYFEFALQPKFLSLWLRHKKLCHLWKNLEMYQKLCKCYEIYQNFSFSPNCSRMRWIQCIT